MILVFVFIGLFASGLNDLFLDSSTRSLLKKNDHDVVYMERIKDLFGDAVIQSIVLKSDTVFREDILKTVLDITYGVREIPGVERVVSMATVVSLKDKDDTLNTDILLRDVPKTQTEMAILKQDTLTDSMFVGEVINRTGTATGIHLFLENRDNEKDFDTRILKDIEQIIQRTGQGLPGDVEIYHIGTPRLRADMMTAMNHDAIYMVPLAGAIVSVVLLIFFRSWVAVLLPVLTGILSIAVTLGFMGLMGFGINPVSVIIPTLLFVMGSTEDIHLLSEYLDGLENRKTMREAIRNMAVKSGTAITLTALTTFLGFVTIITHSTPILREFGIAASFGIAANFFITILVVPTILRLLKGSRSHGKRTAASITWLRRFLLVLITRCRPVVIWLLIIWIGVSLWGLRKLYIETDYVKFFQRDADVPLLLDRLDRDLSGGTNFMVVVEAKETNAFLSHNTLTHVARLQDYLNEHHGKAVGYVEMIRKIHQEMNNGKKEYFTLPDQPNAIAQYNLLIDSDNLYRFMAPDFNKTSILVKTRTAGTREIMAAYHDIKRFAQENLSRDLTYHVTGEMVLVAKASDDMTREIIFCLAIMFFAIFLVSSVLFLSFKAGALAMVPNMLPALVLFGFMGFMNIPLSVATFPVAIIALGIAVDDTIHFMIRYAHELKKGETNEASIMNTIRIEIRPILSTSAALVAGFLMLMFGQFGSTVQFGKLTALCLFTALISDLLITPILLIQTPIVSPLDLLQAYIGKKIALSRCKLLKGLKKREIRKILTMGRKKMLPKGFQFITQGEHSFNMMLILEGEVDVIKEDTKRILGTMGSGDIVGEMSFLTDEPRSASVITRTETEIIEIDKRLIQLVDGRFPRIGSKLFFNISRILSDRLKESHVHSLSKDT